MFKVNNKDTRTTSLTTFWFSLLLTLDIFSLFTSVFIVDFEQVYIAGTMLDLKSGNTLCAFFVAH